jgi:sorbitol-6-phosphate 2-dehydrogenase
MSDEERQSDVSPVTSRDSSLVTRHSPVAIVTGAAQGLGQALALRLGAAGYAVSAADVREEAARETARMAAERYGVAALGVRADVTSEEEVAALFRRTEAELGPVELLVANAGIVHSGETAELPLAAWQRVIDVNLTGFFLCAREAARVMVPRQRGVILQINSKSGKKGSFRNAAYAASKFGGIGLTQSLALELAPHGIRVNAVCPGNLLDSPLWQDSLYEQYARRWNLSVEEVRRKYEEQVPLGRGCTYDDVANVVLFLASDAASYMTGQAINVTGGQEMR